MKRLFGLCSAVISALLIATSGQALAQTLSRQYIIDYQIRSLKSVGSCLPAKLAIEGDPLIFHVNGLPIRTYTVPGAFVVRPNKDEENRFRAPFGGSLLRWGSNVFSFDVFTAVGGDFCTLSDNLVHLTSQGLPDRLLFNVPRDGTVFNGVADVALDLREINPTLAKSLADLEDALQRELSKLGNLAGSIDGNNYQAEQLQALQTEIKNLMSRPLDSITDAELRGLLNKYDSVPTTVRDRLVQLLKDLKTSIDELRAEIARIVADLRTDLNLLDNYELLLPPSGGVNLEDPDTYSPDLGNDDVAEVEIPDMGTEDPFDPDNDPYRVFAEQILTELNKTLSEGIVADRQGFHSVVRLWRFNQEVFETGLNSRIGVSTEEWGAFLDARQSVLSVVNIYMSEGDWFRDTPVRESTKAFVAMLEQQGNTSSRAYTLKSNLNMWQGLANPQQGMVLDSLDALSGGYRSLGDGVAQQDPTIPSTLDRLLDGAIVATKLAATVGLALSPAGDFVDLCEVVTGKELCNPWGADLSVSDRMASGLGLVIGSGHFWRVAGQAVGIGVGVIAMSKIGKFVDSLSDITKEQRQALVARLTEDALEHMEGLTGQQILTLLDRTMKDSAVKTLASHVKGPGLKEASELSMMRVAPQWVTLAQTKGLAVQNMPSLYKKSLADIQAHLKSAGFGSPIRNEKGEIVGWLDTPVFERGQEIWVHPDQSFVRIDLVGTDKNPYPQIKKEISKRPGLYGNDDTAVKVTDMGQLAPAGPSQIQEQMAQWFSAKTGIPIETVRTKMPAEKEALTAPWSFATHIEIAP
ncbi:zinc ribbon domain-containing protein [Corallococcus sp. M7]